MIHADCAFRIGKTHLVCQDYAAVSTGELACVLLADGCSGSPETDFGARLLVRSALAQLADSPAPMSAQHKGNAGNAGDDCLSSPACLPASFPECFPDWLERYHRETITTARCHAALLGLPETSLDTTLLTVAATGDNWFASVSGDGVVVAKNRNGVLEVTVVSYPGGYPYYANYEADPARKRALLQQKNNQRQVETFSLTDQSANGEQAEPDSPCPCVQGRVADYHWVAILSDGIHSFTKLAESGAAAGNLPIPLGEVLSELLAFKTMSGQFVQRRVQRFQQDCARKAWQHHDDISLGVLVMGD